MENGRDVGHSAQTTIVSEQAASCMKTSGFDPPSGSLCPKIAGSVPTPSEAILTTTANSVGSHSCHLSLPVSPPV